MPSPPQRPDEEGGAVLCPAIHPDDPNAEHCSCRKRLADPHHEHQCYGCGFKWRATAEELDDQFYAGLKEIELAERQAAIGAQRVWLR